MPSARLVLLHFSIVTLEKLGLERRTNEAAILHKRSRVGDSSETLDNRPGTKPDIRMVGNDVVLVLPVIGLPKPHPRGNLILRFDPDGEVFAAMSRPTD